MAGEREVDQETQTETTGHEWDGIKELDTPMPRWWLWTFYATIVWAIIYTILFPAWPLINGATAGILGYSSREVVAQELEAQREANSTLNGRLLDTELEAIAEDPELLRFATAGGAAVFRNNCSQCHGAGGQGAIGGYPSLVDDSWLWGGGVADIHQTLLHGIRYEADPDTRFSEMPAFGDILSEEEIDGLVQYVLALSGADHDAAMAEASEQTFLDNCSACHGEDGKGMRELGAPSLADPIWLYGGSPEEIRSQIANARNGVMPAFQNRLSQEDIRKVSIYVHALGGGE